MAGISCEVLSSELLSLEEAHPGIFFHPVSTTHRFWSRIQSQINGKARWVSTEDGDQEGDLKYHWNKSAKCKLV